MLLLLLTSLAVAEPDATPAMSLAMPSNEKQWLTSDDYPHQALRENRKGTVSYRLVVSPAGLPQSCSFVSSGSPDLDQRTCAILLLRSRFKPAMDDQGQPIHSVYKDRFVWTIPGSGYAPPVVRPDIDVTVNKLPAGLKHAEVKVTLLFDPTGQIARCIATRGEEPSALDAVACDQARTLPRPAPVVDETGKPARWLEGVTVGFSVSPHPN